MAGTICCCKVTVSTSQYFDPHPQSESQPRRIEETIAGRPFLFWTDAGVFSRDGLDKGTRILLSVLPEHITGRVLDLGCGWGAMGIAIAALHPQARVTMADINPRAVALARRNADANRVRADAVVSDGFANLEGKFDLITLNPPIRAGKATVYALFEGCARHLTDAGTLMVVIRKQQGAESALKYLKTLFDDAAVVERSGGYWVINCRGGNEHAV